MTYEAKLQIINPYVDILSHTAKYETEVDI